jgi:hypothetical protein
VTGPGVVLRLDAHPDYTPPDLLRRKAEATVAIIDMSPQRFAAVERMLRTVPTREIVAWLDGRA